MSESVTLNVHSNGLIYSPGFFNWIMNGAKQNKRKTRELLAALGIPAEFITPIMQGKYSTAVEGETLVLTVRADQ